MTPLDELLTLHADSLDTEDRHALAVVPTLGRAGLFRRGVPERLGGDAAPVSAAIAAIAATAERSLAAAFVCWGQRVFIELLVQSDNSALRERYLDALLAGRFAGASGLSNAMKFLSGIESVGLTLRGGAIDGAIPWITNARRSGFVAAAAVGADGDRLLIAALPHDRNGLTRSDDLDLIGLRGTQTAALTVKGLRCERDDILSSAGQAWLPRVRPAFLGLQCGLSIGLARVALATAQRLGVQAKAVLGAAIDQATSELDRLQAALYRGVDDGRFVTAPAPLFELRIGLARIVQQAVLLELQASGGRAYNRGGGLGLARRWREAAFIPIVTPSLTQLEGELLKYRARA